MKKLCSARDEKTWERGRRKEGEGVAREWNRRNEVKSERWLKVGGIKGLWRIGDGGGRMRLSRDLEKNYIFVILKNLQFQLLSPSWLFFLSLVKSHDKRFVFRNFPRSRGMGNSNCRIGATSSRVVAPDNCAISRRDLRITQIFAHPVNIDNLC